MWMKAPKNEWPNLVRNQIVAVVADLQPLSKLMNLWSFENSPNDLLREISKLGEAVLQGEASTKIPIKDIRDVNAALEHERFEEYISEQHGESTHTNVMIKQLLKLLAKPDEKETAAPTDDAEKEPISKGAKRGQVKQALTEGSFVRLDIRWMPKLTLQAHEELNILAMFDECFTAPTVLTKVAIPQTKGIRLSPYIADSDFLDMLKDQVDSLALYLGQCVAFDEDYKEVPEGLENFELDATTTRQVADLKWVEIIEILAFPLPASVPFNAKSS
eukprot:1374824-Prymnesium_polylepis.1